MLSVRKRIVPNQCELNCKSAANTKLWGLPYHITVQSMLYQMFSFFSVWTAFSDLTQGFEFKCEYPFK